MKGALFNSSDKMSELIGSEPDLVHILQRLGMTLGFGNKSIDGVCLNHGVDTSFFLLVVNIYVSGSVPSVEQILHTPLGGLLPYLRQSHSYYVDKRLPHIESHLHHIAEHLPERAATVFMRFFEEYKREVVEHFAHEEEKVFPHVEVLQSGRHDSQYTIDTFVESHGDLVDKLEDLLQIIFRYLPESASTDDAVDVVYDILQVKEDLSRHSLLEEKVLVPYVQHLERSVP